jgi:hypothetical protein
MAESRSSRHSVLIMLALFGANEIPTCRPIKTHLTLAISGHHLSSFAASFKRANLEKRRARDRQ